MVRTAIGMAVLAFALLASAFLAAVALGAGAPTGAGAAPGTGAATDDTPPGLTPANGPPANGSRVRIAAVLPNPVATGDRGEYLVLSTPGATNLSGWSVADGEGVARLPNRTVTGRVVLTIDPDAVSADAPVLELRGRVALANGGERIELRRKGRTVDVLSYGRAPEGELYVRDGGGTWQPVGATDRPVVRVEGARVRSFVLPDSPGVPLDHLRNATDRILLGGYTITSGRVVRALCAARERGVHVRALFEGGPVGGITERGADRLDRLARCGVPVSVIGGERARYTFHHPKYAVVDDAALVLTENWGPTGVGGRSNRGWGTLVRDPGVARALAETFRADAGFRDAVPWERYRSNATVVASDPVPTERYPERFEPEVAPADRVSVLLAPDNAESAIVSGIDAAEQSIRVEQISIGSRDHPFVRALLRAARRGVTVRVLLGSASYVRADNREIAAWLNKRADQEGLPLEARLAAPRSRFGKIHAKGLVIDDTVVLGSINWTNGSIRANREVALAIEDRAIARFYKRVFRADWRGGVWSLPVGLFALAALSIGGTALIGSRIRFDPDYSVSPAASER